MILYFKMIINNLLRKSFASEKYSFFRQNISNLKKTSLSKNPVVLSAFLKWICNINAKYRIF